MSTISEEEKENLRKFCEEKKEEISRKLYSEFEKVLNNYLNASGENEVKSEVLKEDNAIDTIFDMNEEMQEKIVDLIAQNLANGVSYDYNKIKELKDEGFDVEAIAEQIKNVPKKDKEEE